MIAMRRTGIGLKPLIAANMAVVLGVSAALLGVASVRLARHALLNERIHSARALLREIGARVQAVCPALETEQQCPSLGDLARRHREIQPELQALTVADGTGRVKASSDPEQEARELWDALGHRAPAGPSGADWRVFEGESERLLVVEVPIFVAGWRLRGAFGLARSDAATGRMTASVLLYGLLITAAMLVIGWILLYRLIVRPVDRLLTVAGRISEKGDLSSLLDADRGTEFGRLGVSLGRMARRIEDDRRRLREQIDELEELNRDLRQAQQAMIRQEKLASVGLLAAGLAHEVGNPLSAIAGYVGMLRTEDLPPSEQADILARVRREIERIDKIIRDLLAYSRPGRGEVRASAPAELAEAAVALLRPQKKFKQIAFESGVPSGLPLVECDPDLVCQVLVNLLLNALDEVDPGGRLWLRAAACRRTADGDLVWPGHDGEPAFFAGGDLNRISPPRSGRGIQPGSEVVVFAVIDDGPGIDQADLVRIFDPFFTTKQPGSGTGLGLAICHASIQSLGGEIWAVSEPGAGTQLAFWLPVAASSANFDHSVTGR